MELFRRRGRAVLLTMRDLYKAVQGTGSYGLVPLIAVLFGLAVIALALSLAGPLASFVYPLF